MANDFDEKSEGFPRVREAPAHDKYERHSVKLLIDDIKKLEEEISNLETKLYKQLAIILKSN